MNGWQYFETREVYPLADDLFDVAFIEVPLGNQRWVTNLRKDDVTRTVNQIMGSGRKVATSLYVRKQDFGFPVVFSARAE